MGIALRGGHVSYFYTVKLRKFLNKKTIKNLFGGPEFQTVSKSLGVSHPLRPLVCASDTTLSLNIVIAIDRKSMGISLAFRVY